MFQANQLNHTVGVRLHADILSPELSARSAENGKLIQMLFYCFTISSFSFEYYLNISLIRKKA